MSYGIEVWNASAQKTLSIDDTITRVFSSFTISGASNSGTISVPGITQARGWVFYFKLPSNPPTSFNAPLLTITDNTVSFNYLGKSNRCSVSVVAGVF